MACTGACSTSAGEYCNPCYYSCTGGCSGCSGCTSCTSCSGCSGCSGCGSCGGCGDSCTSCTSCSGCSGTCSGTCSGGCKGGCSGTCKGSCSACTGACSGACDNGCSGSSMTEIYDKLLNRSEYILASEMNELLSMMYNEVTTRRGQSFFGDMTVTLDDIAFYLIAQNAQNNLTSVGKTLEITELDTVIPGAFYDNCATLLRELYAVDLHE